MQALQLRRGRGRSQIATRIVTVTAALALGIGLASCASQAPTGGSSTGKVSAAGVAEAQKIIDQYSKPPTWQGPDATVDISGLKGKKVVYIGVDNSIPVLNYWATEIKSLAASEAGVEVDVIDAKGSVDNANKGFQQAVAEHADEIVLLAFPPSLFKKQIADAEAAGIKVLTAQTGVPGVVDAGQTAEVSFDYVEVGKLIGDWVVADSKGTANSMIITSDDVPASQPQAQGTESEIKRLCPGCTTTVKDVQIPQWQTSIPTLFQSTLNSQPDITYYLPLYDGQALPGLGALRTANAAGKVKVGAFNATPGIVQQLQDTKSTLKFDLGGHNQWWAYAATDAIFRLLAGATPVQNYHVGLRVFDQSNASLITGSDEYSWYNYDGYKAKFAALWKK
ncbi:MAG: substrate-binding domain-containing protein [Actinomycetota bacterium]|nr:substrate-binding domain-containing protein [Actinomycetota bacterium]